MVAISTCNSNLKNRIIEAYVANEHYLQIRDGLQEQKVPHKFDQCKLQENGILLRKNKVYVPKIGDIRNMVLKEMHNVPYAGHLG